MIITAFVLLHIPDINGGNSISYIQKDTIKIGLLITNKNTVAAKDGAELAIREANATGGCNGNPFKLIVRSLEGPWGTGSKEAVSLVFDDKVWAIMGSNDGRNAHIAEQVSAKTRIVFLSAWAADPTLAQAFVPYYFSCVPNNNQQAEVLYNEIYNNKKFNKVLIIAENSYDAEFALKSFVNKITINEKDKPDQIRYGNADTDFGNIVDKISFSKPSCIAIFGTPSISRRLIEKLKSAGIVLPVFGTVSLMDENELKVEKLSVYEGMTLISSEHWYNSLANTFQNEFRKTYGYRPGSAAAYAYDGMNLLIESVRTASPDREKVQKALSGTIHKGVTGTIQFDERGNRKGPFHLMIIKNGVPVEIK